MNGQVDLTQFAEERYAVGQPVPRKEDPVLLRGEGRYSDDLNLPGQAHAVMVRSTAAHGVIRSIDTDRRAGDAGRAGRADRPGPGGRRAGQHAVRDVVQDARRVATCRSRRSRS